MYHIFLIHSSVNGHFGCFQNIWVWWMGFYSGWNGQMLYSKWSEVIQSCLTLWDPMDCSLPVFSIHGIFLARVPEWVAISFSRGSSRPRDQTWVFRIRGRCFTFWATREAPSKECLLISWLQSPSAVIWEPKKIKSDTVSTVSLSISHEVMGPDDLRFLNVEL